MNIVTRQMVIADAAAVAALSGQLGYAMSADDTTRQIEEIIASPNDIAMVAVGNAQIVGWIHAFYTARIECPSYCEIGGLVVDEQYRGRGVGKRLIAAITDWYAEKSTTLRVRSNVKRLDAHRFYLGAGFIEAKQQRVFEMRLKKHV